MMILSIWQCISFFVALSREMEVSMLSFVGGPCPTMLPSFYINVVDSFAAFPVFQLNHIVQSKERYP